MLPFPQVAKQLSWPKHRLCETTVPCNMGMQTSVRIAQLPTRVVSRSSVCCWCVTRNYTHHQMCILNRLPGTTTTWWEKQHNSVHLKLWRCTFRVIIVLPYWQTFIIYWYIFIIAWALVYNCHTLLYRQPEVSDRHYSHVSHCPHYSPRGLASVTQTFLLWSFIMI